MEYYSQEISEIEKSYRLEEVAKFHGKRSIGLYRILPSLLIIFSGNADECEKSRTAGHR